MEEVVFVIVFQEAAYMSNRLWETLFPSKEEKEATDKLLEEMKKEAIERKHCIVCKHYSYDASVPGFVTYEGDCDLKNIPYFGDNHCLQWELKDDE